MNKETVYNHFYKIIVDKCNQVNAVLNDLQISTSNETKSTAGDKHETAMAMLQIEQANNRTQLANLLAQKEAMQMLNPQLVNQVIGIGSLVKSSNTYFYICASLGKAIIDNHTVYAISTQSPLGMAFRGLAVADCVVVNGKEYVVDEVL